MISTPFWAYIKTVNILFCSGIIIFEQNVIEEKYLKIFLNAFPQLKIPKFAGCQDLQ